jgi:glycosyltransferase involved in cell wall biosynthesis
MTGRGVPKVSVCVPTYNRAGLLEGCLRSILSQTFRDFELLVLDNCSTDETGDVVLRLRDDRLRYRRNDRNIGPFPNMNLAIEMARGEYLCIAHDDDVYLPRFLEREVALLDAHPDAGMVHCAVYETDASGARRRVVRAYRRTRVLEGRRVFVRFLQGHNVCCSSVMVRRSLFAGVGGFDPRYLCADFHLWLRLALHGDVGYISDPLVEMRVHRDTVTSWLDPSRWHREFVAIVEESLTAAGDRDPSLLARRRALLRRAAYAQGSRFLIAVLAAAARKDFALARGYTEVLRELRALGLPRAYAMVAGLLARPSGGSALALVARTRATLARRALAASADRERSA